MMSKEITAEWQELANEIIKGLSNTASEALQTGIKEGVKEAVKEGLGDIAKNAAGGVLQGASWGGLAPIAIGLVLGQLLAVQHEQTKLLKSIQRDVKALVEGPYYAGVTHLEDAQKKHRTLEQRLSLITKARDKFVDARGNQQNLDPFYRAIVEREIGICWLLCGSWIDAKDWLEHSFASANQALIDRRASFSSKKDITDNTWLAGTAAAIGIGLFTGGLGLIIGAFAGAQVVDVITNIKEEEFKKTEGLITSFINSISRILDHFNSDIYHT